MTRDLTRYKNKHYDLLVIGGGINGAAIANMAAASGAKVALIEKNDWASGTSSKSTKLLHGGIRYLENFEFDLVAESLKERFIQWKNIPYLVKPMRFIVPIYQGQGRPFWMMRLGVWFYDVLSGRYSLGGHGHLSREEILQIVPGIKQQGLQGGVFYFDAQMDDARVCLENVLMAAHRGADAANYVEAVEFIKEDGRAIGARMRDIASGELFDVMAKNIIVAVGPWADHVRRQDNPKAASRLRTTKGVHIVYRGAVDANAFLLQAKNDKRIFFVIPFKGNTLIGTTDTDYTGSPDNVRVEEEDIDYLLTQARDVFPSMKFSKEGIIGTFAGVRPLVFEKGSPSKISRKHAIEQNFSGIYYVMGGKYTTYRAIALECVHKVIKKSPSNSERYSLYGSGKGNEDIKAMAARYGVDGEVISYLMSLYGSRYEDILILTLNDPSLKGRLCSCSPAIRAQVAYAIKTEMARTPEDIYDRRLGLSYNDCPTQQCKKVIIEILEIRGHMT